MLSRFHTQLLRSVCTTSHITAAKAGPPHRHGQVCQRPVGRRVHKNWLLHESFPGKPDVPDLSHLLLRQPVAGVPLGNSGAVAESLRFGTKTITFWTERTTSWGPAPPQSRRGQLPPCVRWIMVTFTSLMQLSVPQGWEEQHVPSTATYKEWMEVILHESQRKGDPVNK